MSLASILGINTQAGNDQLNQALAAIQAVATPTQGQLTLPQLQQYVNAGVLTPQQYQAILTNPQAYSQVIQNTQNNSGEAAQSAALKQLGGIAQTGSTPINQATLLNNEQQTNQAMQAARSGITEDAQSRGVEGGGLEFINKLMNEQQNSQNANTGAVNAAASNSQLALNALANEGTLGGQVQNEEQQNAQAQAAAAQQIAEYNTGLQNTAAQYNTQTANQAQAANLANKQSLMNTNTGVANATTQYNAALPQQVYNDQLGKAQAEAGVYNNQANLAQQQASSAASLTGNLLGTGATALASAYGKSGNNTTTPGTTSNTTNSDSSSGDSGGSTPDGFEGGEVQPKDCYAEGGQVHDHSICMKFGGKVPGQGNVPGNSLKNDTVKANLSPREIVIPRSISMAYNAPEKAAQFVAATKARSAPMKMAGGGPVPAPQGAPLPQGMAPQGPPPPASFADVLKLLESQGIELTLSPKGA